MNATLHRQTYGAHVSLGRARDGAKNKPPANQKVRRNWRRDKVVPLVDKNVCRRYLLVS